MVDIVSLHAAVRQGATATRECQSSARRSDWWLATRRHLHDAGWTSFFPNLYLVAHLPERRAIWKQSDILLPELNRHQSKPGPGGSGSKALVQYNGFRKPDPVQFWECRPEYNILARDHRVGRILSENFRHSGAAAPRVSS